ncbi:MAG TPA: glucose dehydrogenase [Cytophagales bacterium]|nr:glucose dehydrogenase [Cytophagales bacterium]
MKYTKLLLFLFFLSAFYLNSCYRIRSPKGGGEIRDFNERKINVSHIALPEGYQIEYIAQGLTYPSGITFDEQGTPYVIEAGYSYGEEWTEPKLLRINADGETTLVAKGDKNGPWNGITYYEGNFYIAEGGQLNGGRIIKISKEGNVEVLVDNLPSYGDHHTNGPIIMDGYLYFGQGTATNSGIVGNDNAKFGWLERKPEFHDIPCRDLTLNGINFESKNALTDNPDDVTETGAYLPYGTSSEKNQVVSGSLPCSGSILRIPLSGGDMELVAWGLRNPFGLAVSPDSKLFITENSFDERGSRPIWGSGDVLWEINTGKWYGWPDFAAGKSIVNDEEFKSPKDKKLKAILASYPNDPPKPAAIFGVHASVCGFDFSSSDRFGFKGEAFVSEFGDMVPQVGKGLAPVGFKISKVNIKTGVVEDFAVNKGNRNGPASWLKSSGLERPVAAKFNPSGNALYIVDFGVMAVNKKSTRPYKKTGVIWKITKKQK